MKQRLHKRPILLAALLALATLPPTQFALCVGDGGHRELELLSAKCCPAEPDHAERTGLEGGDDDCADHCIDTPVGSTSAAGISSTTTNVASDMHASFVAVATLTAPGLDHAPAYAARGRDGPGDTARRTDPSERTTVRRL